MSIVPAKNHRGELLQTFVYFDKATLIRIIMNAEFGKRN